MNFIKNSLAKDNIPSLFQSFSDHAANIIQSRAGQELEPDKKKLYDVFGEVDTNILFFWRKRNI